MSLQSTGNPGSLRAEETRESRKATVAGQLLSLALEVRADVETALEEISIQAEEYHKQRQGVHNAVQATARRWGTRHMEL